MSSGVDVRRAAAQRMRTIEAVRTLAVNAQRDEAHKGDVQAAPLLQPAVERPAPYKKPVKLRTDGKVDRRIFNDRNLPKRTHGTTQGGTLAEQPDRTPSATHPYTDIYGRFLPGFSGTRLGGSAKVVLNREVLKRTNNGVLLVDWVVRVWMGEVSITLPSGRTRMPSFDDRRWAVEWLAERGWGKPSVQVDVAGPAVVVIQNGGDVE